MGHYVYCGWCDNYADGGICNTCSDEFCALQKEETGKLITELQEENARLRQILDKMKDCLNCKHNGQTCRLEPDLTQECLLGGKHEHWESK